MGAMAKAITAIAVAMSLYHILYITHALEKVGVYLLIPPFLGGSLGFILVMVFLLVPMKKNTSKNKLPLYDKIFAFLSAATTFYIFFMGVKIAERTALPEIILFDSILGTILIILILEAVRRVIGMVLTVVVICFILETIFSNYIPGLFQGRGFSWGAVVKQLYLWDTGIFNIPMEVAANVIFAYLLFASFLNLSGAGKFFIDLALSLFGRFRGGPAKVAVLASAFFGTISGSTSANVATTGMITIPMMKQTGYKPHYAAAVEAVASNGGQIMPPVMGAVAFIIPEFLGISYASVCKAAIFPAVLYFLSIFIMVDLEARKIGLKPLHKEEIPPIREVLLGGWTNLVPIGGLIFFLGVLSYEAQFAAMWSLGILIIVQLLPHNRRRLGWKEFIQGLEISSRGMLEVGVSCAAAGIIIGCVGLSGLGQKLSMGLIELSGGNLFFLLLITAVACFILGMGMTSLPIYIMLVVLVAPALVKSGVLPIAAHLFIFYWGLVSFITPPVCIAAFVAAAIAQSDPFKTGWQATRLGIVSLIIPFMFVYGPPLLLEGNLLEVIWAIFTSLIGIVGLAVGIAGYALKNVSWFERFLSIAGGVALVFPGLKTDAVGFGLIGLVAMNQFRKKKVKV